MSLGTTLLFPGNCDSSNASMLALASALNTLRSDGVLSIASAGNSGSGTHMAAPACISSVVSVGAVWDADAGSNTWHGCTDATTAADKITCFSNSNAVTDLFAPGAPTTSAWPGGGISTFFGTSQASPMVAACAAVIRQDDPSLSASQVEAVLKLSSVSVTSAKNGLSFP